MSPSFPLWQYLWMETGWSLSVCLCTTRKFGMVLYCLVLIFYTATNQDLNVTITMCDVSTQVGGIVVELVRDGINRPVEVITRSS